MLICDDPQFIAWQPDFSSSGQASPQWTRLVCADAELSNSIDSVDWFGEPAVQVQLCEECGYAGCASGGYVHVSRLGKHLLWTPPHVDLGDPFESHQYRAADVVRKKGAVAIRATEWNRLRERFTGLPSPEDFPRTTRRDLLREWAAFARRGDRVTPVFGGELLLVPEPTGFGPPQTA